MRSQRAKVLHEVFFKPMLHHVLDATGQAGIHHQVVLVGHQRDKVLASIAEYKHTPVIQEQQLGTGHAVLCAEAACAGSEQIMILCGDTPLIRAETLEAMIQAHAANDSTITLMTTRLDDPFGYGRILSDAQGNIQAIVEQKDASPKQREIQEINAGIYLVKRDFLFQALKGVGTDNSQGEVYLTDIVAIANSAGHTVQAFHHPRAIDVLGVNSRIELAQAHQELQRRHNQALMLEGITMYGPETTLIAPGCTIGPDCIIQAGVQILGKTTVGAEVNIASGAVLEDCHIGDGVVVGANSVLHNSSVESLAHIPPLTHRVG